MHWGGVAAGMGSGFSMRSMMVPDPVAGYSASHEVRHAIAVRGEARPRVSAADERGRSSLPKRHPVRSGQPANGSTDQLMPR